MNSKAERIEQIIQIVNRNLALILSHEEDQLTPLDVRELQKVDLGTFGSDKFAFEMSHFVKSERITSANKLTALWEWNFLKGGRLLPSSVYILAAYLSTPIASVI